MRKKLRLTVFASLLVCGFLITQKWWQSVTESRLHSRIEHELLDKLPELADEDWRVFLDGSQGVIHGTVSSQSLFREITSLIARLAGGGPGSIRGLDSLQCALTVPHNSSLDLSIDDESGRITIAGEIPDAAYATLSAALDNAFEDGRLVKQVQTSSGHVSTAPWAGALGELIPVLVRSVGDLAIKLDGRTLTVDGRVSSDRTRIEIQELLLQRLAGSIDHVRNGLTTLEGELETSSLRVEFTQADTIVLHGSVHSKDALGQLLRGVEAIAPAGFLVESRLRVRPAARGSWWTRPTLAFLPQALASLQGGELRVDARGLQISAPFANPQEQLDLEALARNYFPPQIYALSSATNPRGEAADAAVVLAEVARPPGEPDPADVADPDGEATLEVRTATAVLDEAPETSKIGRLVAENPIYFSSGSTRIRETEREKLATLAEALAAAPELELDIRGLADPVGNAAANRLLAERRCTSVRLALEESGVAPARLRIIGGGEQSPAEGEPSWKLRRVEFAIHANEPAPSPEVAVAAGDDSDWRESIAATHIYFQNASSSLSSAERSKLDQVASLLKASPHGVLAISGFTDRFGNRDFNERLSNQRCEAVRDYLVGEAIPASRLEMQQGGEFANADAGEPSWKRRRVQFQWLELAGR